MESLIGLVGGLVVVVVVGLCVEAFKVDD